VGCDARQPVTGLHLDRTKPPILQIVQDFEQIYGSQHVTEVDEVNEPTALNDVNVPGLQHTVFFWAPVDGSKVFDNADGRNVCFWHKADIPMRSADVRFRG
jgi:hypothetical protein